MRRLTGWWVVLGAVVWGSAGRTAPTPLSAADYDRKYGAELTALAPSALPLFERANAARNRNDHAAAEQLYAQLFAEVPSFVHAERRRCGELNELHRREEALTLCRDAVAKDASAANLGGLAHVLLQTPEGKPPTFFEMDEADSLLKRAAQLEPDDTSVVGLQCHLAIARNKLDELTSCSTRLRELAPNEVATVYFSWLSAASHGDWSEAERLVKRASEVGASRAIVEQMSKGTAQARPWTDRAFHWVGLVLGAWAALCAVLVLVGIVLSRITLNTVESWNHETPKRSASLRAIYRSVLVVCSALYYASLPIVLVSVFAAVGVLLYGMLALGWFPIKLALLAILMAFATLVVILKSVFFRPKDPSPGIRVDLAKQPALRAALVEVADQVGTRVVDTVYLTPDTNLAVFERKGGERCLVIGIAVLEGMPLDAFKAILAHEYGHFSNRDTAGGGFALSVRRSLLLMIIGLARSGHAVPWNPAWWFARGFYLIFLRVSQGASRLQEVLADRHAAEAYGSGAFVTGLKHVIACDLGFDHHFNTEINLALEAKRPLQGLWSPPPGNGKDPEKLSEVLNRKPSPYDSHPAPCDRIRWVERLPHRPSREASDLDAWSLFSDRPYQEREMTLFVYQRLAEQGVRPPALPSELPSRDVA